MTCSIDREAQISHYPTAQHRAAADRIVGFFSGQADVQAVLLTCSCARGKATRDSCLDVAVLVLPQVLAAKGQDLQQEWDSFYGSEQVFKSLLRVGEYSHVDLEFVDGSFVPPYHGWTTGADAFELEIGNLLVYSVPLWQRGDYLSQLQQDWLPYYDEGMRRARLAMVSRFCLNNLHHIPPFVERGLFFQSLNRLHDAFGEFLQALFISRRTYPIAYDKWVKEQVVEILELPELYRQLVSLLEIQDLESRELIGKAKALEGLLTAYGADARAIPGLE